MAEKNKRTAIINALIELMETQSLDDIRVEDLLKLSGVSKTTFYRLFRDKYDVMNSAYLDISAEMVHRDTDMRNQRIWCIKDCNLIRQHARFFQKILSYKGQNSFRDTIRAFYTQNIRRHVEDKACGTPLTDMQQHAIEAYAEASAYTMVWFIMNNDKVSPERMADYAQDCIPQSLRQYFEPDDTP